MCRYLFILIAGLVASGVAAAADLKVAAFHPLLADLARQVGGTRVEVIELISTNGDPHHFEPSPEDLQKATGSRLYLVAGMGLEAFRSSLETIVSGNSQIIEVGRTLPVLHGEADDHDHATHDSHEIDPHWWHSIDRFRRAATVVAEAFATADPAGAEIYRTNAAGYRDRLDTLERWARVKLSAIPRDRRQLATSHAAFNYFCSDFGFTAFPVQGLNREQSPDPAVLAALIHDLHEHHVVALFPEKESNPKLLAAITRDTNIRLGQPLIADGTNSATYEEMVRYNVESIVSGLTGKQP